MGADVVIVGHNDIELERTAARARPYDAKSGGYREIIANSVRYGDARVTYMDMLNRAIRLATNQESALNAFSMPNLAVATLMSYLSQRGHRCEYVNLFNTEQERFEAMLQECPRAVVITTTYHIDETPAAEIAAFVRQRSPQTQIIVGGPYIQSLVGTATERAQDFVLGKIDADIAIVEAQGEATLDAVLFALREGSVSDISTVPNLIYRTPHDRKYQRTSPSLEKHPLEESRVDWDLFPRSLYVPTVYMRTARGCPCHCTFCSYPALSGQYVLADVDHIVCDLKKLRDTGVRFVVFVDDTFNIPLPRFKSLLRNMISERLDIQWMAFVRCGSLDAEACALMRQAGCIAAYLGIESGDDGILQAMRKGTTTNALRAGIRRLRESEILTFGSFIVGFPGETRDTVQRTIDFIEETGLDYYNCSLYFHNPIAPVHLQREQFGIKGIHYSWQHNTMKWQEAVEWQAYILRTVQSVTPLPLYGYSIWSLPYLLGCGLTLEQFRGFSLVARSMLVKSLDDVRVDFDDEDAALSELFRNWPPIQVVG